MRFFTQVEITFEVPDHVGVPKYRGDAPIDYAQRAVAHLRPALEGLIADGPATGYYITGPKRCECVALPNHGPAHGDHCRQEDPRAEQCPVGLPRVITFEAPPALDALDGDDEDEDQG